MKNEIKIPVSSIQDVKTKKIKLFKKHPVRFTAYGLSCIIFIAAAANAKEKFHSSENISPIAIEKNVDLQNSSTNDSVEFSTSSLSDTPKAILLNSNSSKWSNEEIKKVSIELYDNLDKYPHYFSNFHYDYVYYKLDHPSLSMDNVISRVNLGLKYPFYSFTLGEGDLDQNYAFLSKYREIVDYVYDDYLKDTKFEGINNSKNFKLRSDACNACEALIKAAKKSKINLNVKSAFISMGDQEKLYNDTVEKLGKKKAELIVERAGYSYAQLGTKVVFNVKAGSKTEKWLKANAYKYGFVYFAPKGKESVTGYTYNPGSFHYVGKEYAKDINKLGMSFDEYWIRYLFPGAIIYDNAVNLALNDNIEDEIGTAKVKAL